MRKTQRPNGSHDGWLSEWIVAVLLLAATVVMATAPARADEPAISATTTMLILFRIDDQHSAQIRAVLQIRCGQYPAEQREICGALASEFLRHMETNRLARLMSPFFDRNFSPNEIEALTRFFASSDGKKMTEVFVVG